MNNISLLKEIVDFVDIIVMIFGIVGSVGGFVFWWDSQNIRKEVNAKLDNIDNYITQEIKNSAIILSSRMQRKQDSNTVRIATIEEEVEQMKTIIRCYAKNSIGECLIMSSPNLGKISQSLPDNTDFT